jgi:hypothetical protein
MCAGERSLKTWPVTTNYAHLANGASVHMPQSTYYGEFCDTRSLKEVLCVNFQATQPEFPAHASWSSTN